MMRLRRTTMAFQQWSIWDPRSPRNSIAFAYVILEYNDRRYYVMILDLEYEYPKPTTWSLPRFNLSTLSRIRGANVGFRGPSRRFGPEARFLQSHS